MEQRTTAAPPGQANTVEPLVGALLLAIAVDRSRRRLDLRTGSVTTSGMTHLLGVGDADAALPSWTDRIRHEDGTWRKVEDSRRILDEGDQGVRVIGALRDVTAERAEQRRTPRTTRSWPRSSVFPPDPVGNGGAR